MEGKEFVGPIAFLPEEIWENILCRLIEDPLSNEDLTNCRLVCKNWNERISSNPHLWKVACQKLGLNVGKDVLVDYKGIFLRMRKRLEIMKNGGELSEEESIEFQNSIRCMYYHDGIVAIGTYYCVQILELEPALRVVSRVYLRDSVLPLCIHFDDSYLVVGTVEAMVAYKMPTMDKLYSKVPLPNGVYCVTFDKNIDIVVTAKDKVVTFWCLSSGTIHFARAIDHVVEMHLIPAPGLQNGCDYMLLCVGFSESYCLLFDSLRITTAKMNLLSVYDCDPYYDAYVDGHFRNPSHYFVSRLPSSQLAILLKRDIASGVSEEKRRFKCSDMLLVGVGEKYACLLAAFRVDHKQTIITILATNTDHFLANRGFLDGFDGHNDKGVLLVSTDGDRTCYVVRWRKGFIN